MEPTSQHERAKQIAKALTQSDETLEGSIEDVESLLELLEREIVPDLSEFEKCAKDLSADHRALLGTKVTSALRTGWDELAFEMLVRVCKVLATCRDEPALIEIVVDKPTKTATISAHHNGNPFDAAAIMGSRLLILSVHKYALADHKNVANKSLRIWNLYHVKVHKLQDKKPQTLAICRAIETLVELTNLKLLE